MKRLMTGFGVAAAFGLAAIAERANTDTSASQPTDGQNEVTVTGCLERGPDGNYTLDRTRRRTTHGRQRLRDNDDRNQRHDSHWDHDGHQARRPAAPERQPAR